MQKQPGEEAAGEESQGLEAASSPEVPSKAEDENPFVYFDFKVDKVKVGRVVLELFKNIAPRTCENFLQLCCKAPGRGRTGKPLHYKGTYIHNTIPNFMIQGGDITHFDGSGGESIYGPTFEDETFEMKLLDVGILGMANQGQPNTNSSQFFISCAPFPHLQGSNVGFGKVRKGLGVVEEISNLPVSDHDEPYDKILIEDCGQLPANPKDWNYAEDDGLDQYPPYPEDWEVNEDINSVEWAKIVTKAIINIKNSGNAFYNNGQPEMAYRKYKKAVRYLTWVKSTSGEVYSDNATFDQKELLVACRLNMAATNLRLRKFRLAHQLCSEVLEMKQDPKAYFRRGQANFGLHSYEAALEDLKGALKLMPDDQQIRVEMKRVKNAIKQYNREEKQRCANMLKFS